MVSKALQIKKIKMYLVFRKYANAVQIGRQLQKCATTCISDKIFFLILQVSFGKILILIVNLVFEP